MNDTRRRIRGRSGRYCKKKCEWMALSWKKEGKNCNPIKILFTLTPFLFTIIPPNLIQLYENEIFFLLVKGSMHRYWAWNRSKAWSASNKNTQKIHLLKCYCIAKDSFVKSDPSKITISWMENEERHQQRTKKNTQIKRKVLHLRIQFVMILTDL